MSQLSPASIAAADHIALRYPHKPGRRQCPAAYGEYRRGPY
jgi:hypothetical protein